MNIRHNNCDKRDHKNYNAKFDGMTEAEKEEWYDLIYEQGLYLFIVMEQHNRTEKVKLFKN